MYTSIVVPVCKWMLVHREKLDDVSVSLMWANETQTIDQYRGYDPNKKGFMEWGVKLETVLQADTNETLTLFRTDGSEYRSA